MIQVKVGSLLDSGSLKPTTGARIKQIPLLQNTYFHLPQKRKPASRRIDRD
jgi:hypothetical protein